MKNKNLINRTVVFVDLENCCGSSQLVRCFHDEVRQHITEEFGTDHVLINYSTGPSCHQNDEAKEILMAWQGARFVMGRGIDGADRCLIDMMLNEPLAMRSQRVVVVSGDHIFTNAVHKLRAAGVDVTVMSRRSSLSLELELEADRVILLPEFSLVDADPRLVTAS
jgi:hypothetical protein